MARKEDVYTVHYVPATEAQKEAFIKRLYEILFVEHSDTVNQLPIKEKLTVNTNS